MGVENIFKKSSTDKIMYDKIDDTEWVVNSVLVKNTDLSEVDAKNRFWSTAENKFTDSSLGGNIAINVPPQFTRYTDIRAKGRLSTRNKVRVNEASGNYGMGRYYSEVIDDNGYNAYFTFGVPEFNSLISYFLHAIDYRKAVVANSGRNPIAYNIGKAWGTVVAFVAFPVLTPVIMGAMFLYDTLIASGRFDYYYLKPTMTAYWSSVNSIVSMMATELGILAPIVMPNDNKAKGPTGVPVKLDQEDMDFMKTYMPDIISDNNYIDVFSIVTKSQRLANQQFYKEMEMYETASDPDSFYNKINESLIKIPSKDKVTFTDWVNKLTLTGDYEYKPDKPEENKPTNQQTPMNNNKFTANNDGTLNLDERPQDKESWFNAMRKNFDATVREGAQYAIFRVDAPGQISHSFRNNTGDIPIEDGLNSIAKKVQNVEYSLGGGNVGFGIDKVIGYAKDVIAGALDGVTLGLSNVAVALLGDAYMDFPKRWTDSEATFPVQQFKIKLISPYGNPMSQLRNIYIPLAAILAGVLPRSTGPASYTSPFLCSMYLRGQQTITLGMITSLTITRGTSNLAYNKQKRPLAIDVTFTVTDFSKILAVPMPTGIFDAANINFTDDNPFARYIASLCGRDLYTTMNMFPKLKLKVSKLLNTYETMTSPAFWGMRMGDAMPEFYKALLASKSMVMNVSSNL